jgi:very-short-patch-repair endonuclease
LRSARIDGYPFRRQVPFAQYIVDLDCHDVRLIIEIDGDQHDSALSDEERTDSLQDQDYRILRIWNNDVLSNRDCVHAMIARDLRHHPSPSPAPITGAGTR